MDLSSGVLALVGITLLAAFVNGALGYGFSSLSVPVGLLFLSNRVLNPALVLIEVFINIYVLVINWAAVPRVWKRVTPILAGLLPGVAAGSWLLASIHPGWLKFATYALLLPLILFQAAGIRRPIQAERLVGLPFGAGLGFLYSVTTLSGPSRVLLDLKLAAAPGAYSVMVAAVLLDACLLYVFFKRNHVRLRPN